ncbi:isopenicillin N synthase family dioxygenase [Nocardia sp. NPDC052566]|uniref:isopenicillin N synthase family dioxygenase n=1 Tax=Nocardia sp. NPDC052566 TaxID=3364330 RepID=UPI0037C71EB7
MSLTSRTVTVVDGYVPVIDLSAAAESTVAQAIGDACAQSGFFAVVGHGVAQSLIDRMYAITREFFELPAERKAAVVSEPGTCGLREGGSVAKSSGLDAPPDLCDVFVANVLGDHDRAHRMRYGTDTDPWTRANLWPDTPTHFEQTWLAYMAAMETLGHRLMRLFALALGLGETFFDDKIDEHISAIVANFYYPQTTAPVPGQLRRGPHTDWGVLTILYQDDIGGLQVHQDGHGWRDIPFVPGSFIINIGDMMAFWSGGQWVSTPHQVLNPEAGQSNTRLSIPYFYLPNHDAPVQPLTRQGDTPATTPGRWYREKMAATYS